MAAKITQIRTGKLAGTDQSYGMIYAPDKAMPGSLGALREFLMAQGVKAEPGFENSRHVLRISNFADDATLRQMLSAEFPKWQQEHPMGVKGKVTIDRDVPILSLDQTPNEQKSKSFKAWLYKNATGLVGAFATFSGASMVMANIPSVRFRTTGERGSLIKWDKNWKKGEVDKYIPDPKLVAKGAKVAEHELKRPDDPLSKKEIRIRKTLFIASTAFVAAAVLLFSFGFSKNRSMNELLAEADEKLEKGDEEAAFKEAKNEGISKTYNWVKQNVWKIASPLNIFGGIAFTTAAIIRAVGQVGETKEKLKKNPHDSKIKKDAKGARNKVFMEAAAGFTGFMAQFLILLMPKSKVAGFGGLDTYVASKGNKAVQEQYKDIESDVTGKTRVQDENKSKAFFQKYQMRIASTLSMVSNFFFGGIPAIEKITNPEKTPKPKEQFFYGVFVNNMFADTFTGMSVPSSSHAPQYVYSTLAAWVDKKLPKDASAQRTEEFITKASKWLASQSEVQMSPEDIAKGVKTTLNIEYGREHCAADSEISAKLMQLKVVSPFASPSRNASRSAVAAHDEPEHEKAAEVSEKPSPTEQLAEAVEKRASEEKLGTADELKERPSAIKELAAKGVAAGHGDRIEKSLEADASHSARI